MNALNAIATEPTTGTRPRFGQIVLTAPDVDADSFRILARNFRLISERTTLYASASDEALALSKQYQGYQRAGDVGRRLSVWTASTASTSRRSIPAWSGIPTTEATRQSSVISDACFKRGGRQTGAAEFRL
jgi:hypothetical protein